MWTSLPDEPRVRSALEALREHGYVVLESFFSLAFVERLRAALELTLAAKMAVCGIPRISDAARARDGRGVLVDFRPEGGNHDFNRWCMHLPSRSPFIDPELVG